MSDMTFPKAIDALKHPPTSPQDSAQRLIAPSDAPQFAALGRQPFAFRHALHSNPLFTLEAIRALAGRLPDHTEFKAWQNGRIKVEDGWATREDAWLPFDETLANIAETNSVVVLKHVEQDEVFGPVLQQLLGEVFAGAPEAFREDVVLGECLVFVNSPGRLSPYHFDLEPSFLLQISGEKTVHALPGGDRTIVCQREMENYCGGGDFSAGIYKPELQQMEKVMTLNSGDGAYFPSTGPHWVQNGDTVSISVNVNFDIRSMHHRLRHVHGFNHRMRRWGLAPAEPGTTPMMDDLKARIWANAMRIKRLIRNRMNGPRPSDHYPVWSPPR
ncbi:MAG: hypothetical protein KGJ57_18890 [Sphingomonadales bacterium]|nr:hypothetical protein [Sphingomonadales bacterium]MDE2171464.1 hypothetical protein [Sphingomonadales bacterium]